ncbi:N-acetylmannosamine-6-phosphate 2-epimerase [Mycoplasma sp. 1654_15]|nr:N-acetylmannosamine-6-phosphate 2-epimerase [Mycoplasma sp. 1654_15]QJB71017.1 N-acetylmannosamine-6-phosphate 2-epimerase [Mycoplasma sp. 1654_15]
MDTLLKNKAFIVSCQVLKGEPMYGGKTVLKMAKAAISSGAEGIRTSQINNIKDIINADFKVPIIGIIKKKYKRFDVVITPTIKELKQLIDTKVDIIAIDATLRKRPKNTTLEQMVEYFKKHKFPHQKLMADCSDYDDVEISIKLGFDYIGTTLRGYTETTKKNSSTENDYHFLKWASALCKANNLKLIAEGGFDTPKKARDALIKGNADAVVVGSAITRPQYITKQFYDKIKL